MKYRILTPAEMEAYEIGYKVGSRQIMITDIKWESESEHKIYRKGYLAGCKDKLRNNVNNVNNVNNAGVVEQCQQCPQCQNRDSVIDTDIDIVTDIVTGNNNILLPGIRARKESGFIPPTLEEVFEYAKQQNDMAGCGGFRCSKATAEEFWGNYTANGWVIGNDSKTPVRDWKAKLRQWCARNRQRGAEC